MTDTTRQTKFGWIKLASAAMIVIGIWGAVLPAVGRMASVKEWIQPLQRQGINPSGLYYTDVFENSNQR